jgi:hypothetical protein
MVDEVRGLRIEDVDPDGGVLYVPGRPPVELGPQAFEILKGWIRRGDRGEGPYLLPHDDRARRWAGCHVENQVRERFQSIAEAVRIPGRLTLGAFYKFWTRARARGRVELGEEWRNTRQPAPKPSGPPSKYPDPRQPARATWPTGVRPSIELYGPDKPVKVRGKDKGVLPPSWYEVAELLVGHREGLAGEEGDRLYGNLRSGSENGPINRGWREIVRQMRRDADFRWAIIVPPPGRPAGDAGLYRVR